MPTNGTILGLDLAATTGWALYDGKNIVAGGTWGLAGIGSEYSGWRLASLADCLRGLFTSVALPGLVACEAPFVNRGKYGNPKTALMLAEYTGVVKVWCHRRDLKFTNFAPASIKKFATGNFKATKTLMRTFAENEWPGVEWIDDNHVDAAWVAAYAASQERDNA